jgi:hypothetical protein
MSKKIPSEEKAKEIFHKLGFNILERDYNGQKKGADFFIEHEDAIQSIEVKSGKWQINRDMPIPQFNRLLAGGLLVIIEDNKVVDIKTKEDIVGISPPNRIIIKWKKIEL